MVGVYAGMGTKGRSNSGKAMVPIFAFSTLKLNKVKTNTGKNDVAEKLSG